MKEIKRGQSPIHGQLRNSCGQIVKKARGAVPVFFPPTDSGANPEKLAFSRARSRAIRAREAPVASSPIFSFVALNGVSLVFDRF